MRALIEKEWRDNRWMILSFLVLAPLLSLGLKWGILGWKATDTVHSMRFVIPLLTLLYILWIAADLIAADSASGQYSFLFTLPVRAGKIWAAKAVFLFTSTALILVYLLGVEVLLLEIGGKSSADLFTVDSLEWSFLLAPIVVVGAAAMTFSALVNRGLAAVLLALLVVAVLGWAASHLGGLIRDEKPAGPLFYVLCLLTGAGFLVASLTAFSFGRIHLGSRLRRVVLAAAAFLVVIVPPSAWAGIKTRQWLHLEPYQQDIAICEVEGVDPSGEWALVMAARTGKLWWWSARRAPTAMWAVNLESGMVRDLSDLGWTRDSIDLWTEGPGRIVLHQFKPTSDPKRWTWMRMIYDLEKGEVISTRPGPPGAPNPGVSNRRGSLIVEWTRNCDWWRIYREGREPVEVDCSDKVAYFEAARDCRVPIKRLRPSMRKPGGWEYFLWMLDTGEERPIAEIPSLLPSTPDRHGWRFDRFFAAGNSNIRIIRVPLDGSPAITVIEGQGVGIRNRQSTRALAVIDGRAYWLEADAAEPAPVPGGIFATPKPRLQWSADGRVCMVLDGESAYRIFATTDGPRVEAIAKPQIGAWSDLWLLWFDGERCLVRDTLRERFFLLNLDGSSRQILPSGGDFGNCARAASGESSTM